MAAKKQTKDTLPEPKKIESFRETVNAFCSWLEDKKSISKMGGGYSLPEGTKEEFFKEMNI